MGYDIAYKSAVNDNLMVADTQDSQEFERIIKEAKQNEQTIIGTHSGIFHCDEVLATTLLLHTKQFENSIIVRSRNMDLLKKADLLCDVGGIFDKEKMLFDHHQS